MMFEMSMIPQVEMQANPALLNLVHLLALPTQALQQTIDQELTDNPALEAIETNEIRCASCGGLMLDGLCVRCLSQPVAYDMGSAMADSTDDPLLLVASPRTLAEGLELEVHANLSEHDQPIALAVIASLDEHGFLTEEPADLAELMGIPVTQVEHVVAQVQALGPPGIATRDVRSCLLAQLQALAAQGIGCIAAYEIVEQHLEDLGAHRYTQIARALHITTAEVEAAHQFIQTYLWPYPAQATQPVAREPEHTRYMLPDLAIVEKDEGFKVEIIHSPRRLLRLNPLYMTLARQAATLTEAEQEHVRTYVARARVFLANLRQRESTLQQIGEAIVARQEAFLRQGVHYLEPMTRSELAVALGVHESTVSRAVSDKTVLLPDRRLMPLSEFFVAARKVQAVLRELIEQETTRLSDQELAQLLTQRGYPIARRTVTKYRSHMKILPSHLR